MILVNRDDFMAWVEGVLMSRDAKGNVTVGDKEIHDRAYEALSKGEIIGLTCNDEIVTTMSLEEGGYVEKIAG
jgi:hypothetical protein